MTAPTVLLLGAGAIGTFYASRLSIAGATVGVICRSNYSTVKRHGGFRMKTRTFGEYLFTPAHIFSSPAEAAQTQSHLHLPAWDFIIVATKALPPLDEAAALLDDLVTPDQTCIVLIQNGVGIEMPYRRRFPHNPILTATTILSGEQTSPGVMVQNQFTRIDLGPYYGPEDVFFTSSSLSSSSPEDPPTSTLKQLTTTSLTNLTNLFKSSGLKDPLPHFSFGQIQLIRWHKLATNAAFNPTSILSGGLSNRLMTNSPALRTHLKGIMDEILNIAIPAVFGHPLPSNLPTSDQTLNTIARADPKMKASMLIDWEAGRDVEVEVILGNALKMTETKGVMMPRCQTVYALLTGMVEGRKREKEKEKAKL